MYKETLILKSTTEPVKSTALPLESINHVHGSYCFAASVLGVGDGVTDHVLQEYLQHATCLFIDQSAYSLHAAPTSQTADGRLCDALDVVAEHFAVALCPALSQPLSALSSS
ncbi:hypothetical protein MIMGU_mgv1a016698mg [Erythranthe guttata]|uniref:Uncharacterized protein n=1 Tax=Erythranthe guttata TaxID=4155 RepID=A0A022QI31_ERYGU|nr:hypothetical protein MIMGU_mgv1a016698mg [Erythranthe guttata]